MIRNAVAALLLGATALPCFAGESWDQIREELYGTRPLLDGARLIALDVPYRTPNDARTQIAAHVVAPEGGQIARVSVILDENPMPVSAVFALDSPQDSFFFDVTMRVNGPTPLHVVA
ncbi:thiosulfate oxidation carrier protein SoxY, partial [Mameliella alba]|uniref:thiosulfate oxidation carrier protein SoxY n=1 Tax=Mameliella alba TaxID=561184 RepID=UPI001C9897B3